jgi:hypothetical protein
MLSDGGPMAVRRTMGNIVTASSRFTTQLR